MKIDMGRFSILHGDALSVLKTLPSDSVHCVVTSPPYFGLRDYSVCECSMRSSSSASSNLLNPGKSVNPNGSGTVQYKEPDPNCGRCHGTGHDESMNLVWDDPGGCEHEWQAMTTVRKGSTNARFGSTIQGQGVKTLATGAFNDVGETKQYRSDASSFCGKCGAWKGQLGLEPNPDMYVKHLTDIFREVRRVLRPDGTFWLNIGDCYAGGGGGNYGNGLSVSSHHSHPTGGKDKPGVPEGLNAKDLVGIPWRVAFSLQKDWYIRSDIIWDKPNPMPESVRDRPTSSHEYVFLLTKEPRYFYDADAVREKGVIPAGTLGAKGSEERRSVPGVNARPPEYKEYDGFRNKRSVWNIKTESFEGSHFACVDNETEALTPDGWKRYDVLKDGDYIASWGYDRVLSWQSATFHRFPFKGELISVESRDLSMRLTDEHRVPCRNYRTKGDWIIKQAQHLGGLEEVPTSAPFVSSGSVKPGDVLFAELCGWVLTDGGYRDVKKGTRTLLYQTAGRGKHERIESLLKGLEVEYRLTKRLDVYRKGREDRIYRFSGEISDRIHAVFPRKEGNYAVLRDWNDADLLALWNGMTEGDGHRRKDGRIHFVGNRVKVDFYQALSIRLGMTCRASKRKSATGSWDAFVSVKRTTSLRGTKGKGGTLGRRHYEGVVWCPSVFSGMWLARRNGRPFITGNTFPTELVDTCLKAGTSQKGVCTTCGTPWTRLTVLGMIVDTGGSDDGKLATDSEETSYERRFGGKVIKREHIHIGWRPDCSCYGTPPWPDELDDDASHSEISKVMEERDRLLRIYKTLPCGPSTVLDPFSGSGTVGTVALHRHARYIGIEMKSAYVRMSFKRIQDSMENRHPVPVRAISLDEFVAGQKTLLDAS